MSKSKIFAGLAAVAFGTMLFMPGPADARDRVNGPQTTNPQSLDQYEWSSHRRRYRHRVVRRYWGPSYGYYGPRYYSPYYGYAGYPYHRPWYGPRAGIGIGPFGFGVGFGW